VIKLIEEPVAFIDNVDEYTEEIILWIYKNPDWREVEDVLDRSENIVRLLIHKDDYYIASAMDFIHNDMVALLKDYNHLHFSQYVHAVIKVEDNEIHLGEASLNGDVTFEEAGFMEFKNIYDKLMAVSLIDKDTKITDRYSLSRIKPQLLKDFLNI